MTLASLPTLTLEVAFAAPAGTSWLVIGDPARGVIGTNTLGPGLEWTDVTAWLRSGATSRGRARQLDRYRAATMTVELDNRDRRFDARNLAGPYVAAGVSQVGPGLPIRLRATWQGTTYDVFRGTIDSWSQRRRPGPDATVEVRATCPFKLLGKHTPPPQTAQGAGETSGARVNRVLTNAGFPGDLRRIAGGRTTLQATTLAMNSLAELHLVADTENGAIYCAEDGALVFEDRYSLLEQARSNTSQATFGDGPGELRYAELAAATIDDELVRNDVSIARVGGAPQRRADLESVSVHGPASYVRADLICQTDTEAASVAEWVLAVFGRPEERVDAMALVPQHDPAALWPQVLGRRLRDRITVRSRPPGGGVWEQDVFVEGIDHRFDPAGWRTSWSLASAAAYGGFLVLDSPTIGIIGTHRIAY